MTALKVEIDIITSISANSIGRVVNMYVEMFKTDIIDFIGIIRHNVISYWLISLLCEIKGKMSTLQINIFITILYWMQFLNVICLRKVWRNWKSKEDKQYNVQKKKEKRTNNNLLSIIQRTKDRVARTPLKIQGKFRCFVSPSS